MPVDINQVTSLLYLEASLLDDGRYREWLDLYTQDLEYWVPIRVGQTSPHDEVSVFYEDRATLEFRVARLLHPDIHIQVPPSRTCRQVTNVMLVDRQEDDVRIHCQSKLVLHEYRPQLPQHRPRHSRPRPCCHQFARGIK